MFREMGIIEVFLSQGITDDQHEDSGGLVLAHVGTRKPMAKYSGILLSGC